MMEDDGCKPVQRLHLAKSQAQSLVRCVIVFLFLDPVQGGRFIEKHFGNVS